MLQQTASTPARANSGYIPVVPAAKRLRLPPADHRLLPRVALSLPKLSLREREVLSWVVRGKTDWEIGEILMISAKTVNFHVEGAKRKLQTTTRMHAAILAVHLGIVQPPAGLPIPDDGSSGPRAHQHAGRPRPF